MDPDARLSIVSVRPGDAPRVLHELAAAGFAVLGEADLPAPDVGDVGDLDGLAARGALAAEVAGAFGAAAATDADAARAVASTRRADRDAVRLRLEGLGDLHDRLIEELGAGPTIADQLGATWGSLLVEAERLDLPEVVAELAGWIDAVADGTARRHPLAVELAGLVATWDQRWSRSVERERLSRRVRDLLGGRIDEWGSVDERALLERCYDHPPTLNRLPARVAAAAAAETGRLGRLSDALDRAETEVAAFDREVADHDEDRRAARRVVVATARRREAVRHELSVATEQLGAALAGAPGGGVAIAASVSWLGADELRRTLERTARIRPVVFLGLRDDLPPTEGPPGRS